VGQQQQCKPQSTVCEKEEEEEEEEEAQRVLGLSTCHGALSVLVKLKLRAQV
jgi:hypothetical protein